MSVKRYDIGTFCGMSMELSSDGAYVRHDDYAALETRCAEMASENAGLKDLARSWANATDDRLFEEHGEIFHDSIDACEEELKTISPATDAFLAEVRAQGVEMMAAEADQLMDEFGDDSYKVMVTADLQLFANAFAAQLRKGVQS